MLKKRVITTFIGLPILVAAVWFDYPIHWFTALITLCGIVGAIEFYTMIARARLVPLSYFGIVWCVLFILSADSGIVAFTSPFLQTVQAPLFLLVTGTVLPLIWVLGHGASKGSLDRCAWTLAGIVYVGGLLSVLVSIRGLVDGRNWVMFVLLTTFASDTTAFLVGRAWGRHKLAPTISPAKTREGSVAGLVGAVVISLIFLPQEYGSLSNPLYLSTLTYTSAIGLAIAVSVFGQLGDLVESLMKRNLDTKDSGRLLPGHGGVLDRMDSVVFAGVVVYYFVVWIIQ
jgi:phosphatidate cytidylyltransferase